MESKSNSTTAEISSTDEPEVSFSSGSFTPSTEFDSRMALEIPVLEANGRDFVYGFILLHEHLSEETQQELEALGVTLLGPHGNNLYKAKFPLNMEVIVQVTRLPHIEWVGYSTQDQKLDGDLKQMIDSPARSAAVDTLPIVINLFDDDVDRAFERHLETTGAILRSYDLELRAYYPYSDI